MVHDLFDTIPATVSYNRGIRGNAIGVSGGMQ